MILKLEGIRSTPLSGPLCAFGLLRALSEQHDPQVRGFWRHGTFHLKGIGRDELIQFLLEAYAPAPIVSPWNKEGDPTQNDKTQEQFNLIAQSGLEQLQNYRQTIESLSRILNSPVWESLKNAGDKRGQIALWRSRAPEAALPWIDAAAILTPDAKPSFPAILGTGGNDGRFEMSRLYQGEIIRLFLDERAVKHREGWVRNFLFNEPGPPLVDTTTGQFDPVATGGINSSPQGSAKSAANPWAILFNFEGTLAFRAGSASRLGFDRKTVAAAPFAVRSVAIHGDEAEQESTRSELWVPLWSSPTTWDELSAVMAEGRLMWQGQQASNALDARRAVANLGAARGLTGFERYGFSERNGLAYVAVHSGTIPVQRVGGVSLLSEIDHWIRKVPRGDTTSTSINLAVRRVQSAQYELLESNGAPEMFLEVLVSLFDLERTLGRSSRAQEKVSPLYQRLLPAVDWYRAANIQTPEFRLAAALASLSDGPYAKKSPVPPSAQSVALAVRGLSRQPGTAALRWPRDEHVEDPFARQRDGANPLLGLLQRRTQVVNTQFIDEDNQSVHQEAAFKYGVPVSLTDVNMLLTGVVDYRTVLRYTGGLSMLNWVGSNELAVENISIDSDDARGITPPWFAALKVFFDGHVPPEYTPRGEIQDRPLESDEPPLHPDRKWGRQIRAGQLESVSSDALQRLRRVGSPLTAVPVTGNQLPLEAIAIGLLVHLDKRGFRNLRNILWPLLRDRDTASVSEK